MAFTLSERIQKNPKSSPPMLLFYGEGGSGKTSLLSQFQNPIVTLVNETAPHDLDFDTPGPISSFEDILQVGTALYEQPHDYKTWGIDSLTGLQPLLFDEVCRRGDDKGQVFKSIEGFPYGRGYQYAERVLHELIECCHALRRDRGMTIVFIGHSKIVRFDEPGSSSYDRFELDLHARLSAPLFRACDGVFLIKRSVTLRKEDVGFNNSRNIAEGGNALFIYSEGRPGHIAKNRFNLPAQIRFDRGKGYEALAPYLYPNLATTEE
jgi:hypothetical protein